MNILIQNILVFLVAAMAMGFLIKKFFLKPKVVKTNKKGVSKPCGAAKCGCH
ncbi:hypothetical protein [Aquimarina sp. RZ0]|uniref:hypothetical protein n=1 Tax=Aquimarina sp. RZ0 TaxID=2607730 RepID=UPI00165FC435|nr:hypothetical protein [Aquimarina sp. RZ0]